MPRPPHTEVHNGAQALLRFIEEWVAGERPSPESFRDRYPDLFARDTHLLPDLEWTARTLVKKLGH